MSRADLDFDALDAAAVALLEPVVVPDPQWRATLARALDAFAATARGSGFDPLGELAARLRRSLDAAGLPNGGDASAADELAGDEALRARAGGWAADLLHLCAGRLEPPQAAALAEGDEALAMRLAELAQRIAGLRGEEAAGRAPARTVTVARDELDMLADEAASLGDELDDGLERIADAAALLGLEALAALLRFRAADLEQRLRLPAQAFAALDALLDDLPEALAGLFGSAGRYRQALELLGAPQWPRVLAPGLREAAANELDALELVGSRQIEVPEPAAGAPDLSLAIPADADRSVVDSLLHELPTLSAQLGERIGALGAGNRDDVVVAQRLAHTLKGSANTVGVRGIASITHRLEDLLQLVALRLGELPPDLRTVLGDAADCVAEMCEAVAGLGPAPAGAAAVHARIVDWIARLLGEAGREAEIEDIAEPSIEEDMAAQPAFAAASDEPSPSEAPAAPEPEIRVTASLVGRLLDLVDEAAILVAHAREQALELERSRATMRLGGDQLQDLASELERLVDIRGLALSEQRDRQSLDSLELDEYNDLHTVSRRIAESGADGKLVEQQLGANLAALRDSLARLERLQAELRDCALRTRMAAFGSVSPRLHRTVRQAARMAGRETVLRIEGEDTLVDAGMLSTLVDALAHLLRNAVDHGVEPPERRLARGKPALGTIRVSVRRDGASLRITCEDDGEGLDNEAIRQRAVALGLLDAAAPIDPQALRALILAPGFSTRERASQLSGRGIGLDVVRQTLEGLRGAIAIQSTPGAGTRFTLTVPLGLASLPVMMLRSATHALALSVRGIEKIVPAPVGAEESIRADGADWPAVAIEALLGLPDDVFERARAPDDEAPIARSALLVRAPDGSRAALVVPEPEAPRSVVVRPMPGHVPRIPGIDGVAVLGDGAVAPVLDPGALLAAHADGSLRARRQPAARSLPAARTAPLCLVVDDSVSVRRTTEIFVRDMGFEVDGAADGVEALERVRRRVPDLVLVDMEMPRMNGLEFVRALRADARTSGVAVIMITSRYSKRHEQLALDAGVDVFLTKPYTEDALATQILASLERPPAPGLSGVSRMG